MSKDDEPDPGGEPPEWSPENELDPVKVQAETLKMMRELMKLLRTAPPAEPAAPIAPPALIGGPVARVSMPKPPTFEEKKAQFKKAWEAAKEVAPDAHYAVQCEIFRMLAHHIEYAIPDFEGDAAIVEGPTPPPA